MVEANTVLALLLYPPLRGKDLSEVCADLRDAYHLPGSSADVRTVTATLRQLREIAEIANDRGRELQFVATPGRGPRFPADRQSGLVKQALVSTRDVALNWMAEEILHIQCEEDEEQMAFLQSATLRMIGAKEKCADVSTARYDELNAISRFLRERSRRTRAHLFASYASDRARALTGRRLQAFKDGLSAMWKALRLRKNG